MRFVDFHPTKGAYSPGEVVRFVARIRTESPGTAVIHLSIIHLAQTVGTVNHQESVPEGEQNIFIEWQAPSARPRGYGLKAELLDHSGTELDSISTAFDVLPKWTAFPRYGFLTDFTPGRSDIDDTLETLAQFHINGLQFYDWLYRHDSLLPPENEYDDPLGRASSLKTVRELIESAHFHGMAAMPYLAVYAASIGFWQEHQAWGLYDAADRPITFEDFLGLMDPTPGSSWTRHLLDECGKVLGQLPFDGLHVDQYGDPKIGFNAAGEPLDIPAAFVSFIQALKENHPRANVVFNAVGNWPIEALAAAPQDFVYIEIWPPDVFYRDIRRIAAGARAMSGGKPVVIALYLPVDRPVNVRLADALIFSLGGSRIELGEQARLLVDPYFPKHQPLTPDLKTILRRYYDFVVRYGDWLGPSAIFLEEWPVSTPPGIWITTRSAPGWFVLSLLNFSGLGDPRWDEVQPPPTPLTAVNVRVDITQPFRQVLWATPDGENMGLVPLPWTLENGKASLVLPGLDYWAIIAFELEPTEQHTDD